MTNKTQFTVTAISVIYGGAVIDVLTYPDPAPLLRGKRRRISLFYEAVAIMVLYAGCKSAAEYCRRRYGSSRVLYRLGDKVHVYTEAEMRQDALTADRSIVVDLTERCIYAGSKALSGDELGVLPLSTRLVPGSKWRQRDMGYNLSHCCTSLREVDLAMLHELLCEMSYSPRIRFSPEIAGELRRGLWKRYPKLSSNKFPRSA